MTKLYSIGDYRQMTPKATKYQPIVLEENTLRTEAMKRLHPRLRELIDMHEYARPNGSQTEEAFISQYIDTLPNMRKDAYGNRHCVVGKAAPTIAWSSHTDTVHQEEGKQALEIDKDGLLALDYYSEANCLGADDTAGVWLMRRLIMAGKPGLYIFHRGEEDGGLGSRWIVKNTPELVHGIEAMIALDRRGYDSVITEQSTGVTASTAFAQSLADQLGGEFIPDDGGIFTDSAFYKGVIPECTNLSIGYHSQHSKHETLDFQFTDGLLVKLLSLRYSELTISRDPTAVDPIDQWRNAYYGNHSPAASTYSAPWLTDDGDQYDRYMREQWEPGETSGQPYVDRELVALVRRHPEAVAHLLGHWSLSADDVYEALRDYETMTRES
jgi:hypothetical protein